METCRKTCEGVIKSDLIKTVHDIWHRLFPWIGMVDDLRSMDILLGMCPCQTHFQRRHATAMPKIMLDTPGDVLNKIKDKMPYHCHVQTSCILCLKNRVK